MADTVSLHELRQFQPFVTLPETHLNDLRRRADVVVYPKGKILFKRDEVESRLYFLLDGSVDLADANFNITATVAGDARSKQSLDVAGAHTLTAITTSPVRLISLQKDAVDLVLTWDQAGNYMVADLTAGEGVELDWMSCLLQSALFAQVPPANIQKLFARFEEVTYTAEQPVVLQGEPGDYFYVVKSGRARIVRRMTVEGQSRDLTLAELRAGDVFGEDALIGDAPRNASIIMITEGALMRLNKDDFQRLLQNPVLRFIEWSNYIGLVRGQPGTIELVDVRLPLEFKQGAIKGARNLPLHALRQQLETLAKDCVYVTTCDGGRRSLLAAYILNQHGFDAVVLKDSPEGLVSSAA